MANKILVFTELTETSVKNVTLEILGKLTENGQTDLHVCAIGDIPGEAKSELAKWGAKSITAIKNSALEKYSPEGYSTALEQFIKEKQFDYVFAGATSLGKDLLPRVSGVFSAGLASDVTNFLFEGGEFFGTRPLFAGKCLAKVKLNGEKPHFITVRPNALGLSESPASASSEDSTFDASINDLRATITEIIKGATSKLDLTEANIIVSGGRSMKSAENFKILDELADVLGATVGASRAAVDSGLAPHAMQVGQTGKTVSPSLYIACGISGAIQHLAGMRTSKVIVAINTDPDAPIFTKADYGIVGDLFQIVPLMTEEFKKIL